ncbi:hypothetical protein EI94DRAFT_1803132 [Lactarius quietus]|nr:hypothetical protein EI94DRAFT_1803132 [Lactarius quietus]
MPSSSGGNLTSHHTVHTGDLPYSDPVLRTSSSSESFSTEYGPDETSQSEGSLSATDLHAALKPRSVSTLHPVLSLLLNIHLYFLHSKREMNWPRKVNDALLFIFITGMNKPLAARFIRVMHTLRSVVAVVEEIESIEASLARSPHGVLEDPPTTDDLATLMQGLMGPPSSVPASAPSVITAPTSPMPLDTQPALLYGRTIGIAAGKGKLWAR